MKNYILKNSMLSLATIVVLGATGCSDGNDSNSNSNTEIEEVIPVKTEVLSGNVNLADNTAKKAIAKSIARADALEKFKCGTSAMVQLYAIDDTQYEKPLLKEAIEVNHTNCAFSINDTDFVDENSSSSDNQYLIRTLIQDGNKTVELSATKLSEGVEVGVVDPIATLIKERFSVVIAEVKESMGKLESLGVTADSIVTAIENIIADFEKNLDNTVANLKEDIASGKVTIDTTMFETTETLDTQVTEAQLKERTEKVNSVVKTFETSSASTTFTMLESSMKREQLDNVTITKDTLRTALTPAIAEIKYGVIESFVKIGLNVHDGQGNLIVFIPIQESRKGELPGKMYQLSYSLLEDGVTKIESIGDDFQIRVINPKTDLNQLNGNEDWYRNIQENNIVIPSAVIDAMIVAKDHTITMQELGKALDKALGNDGSTDLFEKTKLYTTAMNDSVEVSVENIVNVFKDDFLKRSFAQLLWEEIDTIFNSFNGENKEQLVADILNIPFIVQGDENSTTFLERLGENSDSIDFIVDKLESSLSSGIPVSDSNDSMLQFKTGTTITANSSMKPLASLAMIDLFMEAKGSEEEIVFEPTPLSDMFGWLFNSEDNDIDIAQFNETKIWSFNDMEDEQVEGDTPKKTAPKRKAQPSSEAEEERGELTLEEEAQKETEIVMSLIKVITGNDDIKIERNFKSMNAEFAKTMQKLDMKSSNAFNFETEFRGNITDFGDAETQETAVTFMLRNFNNQTAILDENDTLLLAPVFVNQETYERTTFMENNVTVHFNVETQKYEIDSIEIYNPEIRFDESATVTEEGQFISDNDFELILVKSDGTRMQIATFPLFPIPNNDLDMPFYYDSEIRYSIMPDFRVHDEADDSSMTSTTESDESGYNMFVEHQYLEDSSNVFFPQITKTDGVDVGENLFSYDIGTKVFTKVFTKNLIAGVVSDAATMTITLLNRDYEDDGSTPVEIETIDLNGDVREGARLELALSGPQIETQTVKMDILYIGESGQVEYELYKEVTSITDEYYLPYERVPFNPLNSYGVFSNDLLVDKIYYLAIKPLDPNTPPYLAKVEFNGDGEIVWNKNGEETREKYAIVDGSLEIYNEDGSLSEKVAIQGKDIDGSKLAVKIFDDKNNQRAESLMFETVEARDSFIEKNMNKDDIKDIEYDIENILFVGTLPNEAGPLAGTEVNVKVFNDGSLSGSIGSDIMINGQVNEDGTIKSESIIIATKEVVANCTGTIDPNTGIVTINAVPTIAGSEPFTYTLTQQKEFMNETDSEPDVEIDETDSIINGYDLSVVIDNITYNKDNKEGLITYTLYNNGDESFPLKSDYILGNEVDVDFYSGLTTEYTEERSDGFGSIVTMDFFLAYNKSDILNELDAGGNIQRTRTFSDLAWHEDKYMYAKVSAKINADSEGKNAEDLDTNLQNNIDIKEIIFE